MFKTLLRVVLPVSFLIAIVSFAQPVYAACESNYGGGETCIYNKSFEVEKKVRVEGDNSWKDKVIDVEQGQVVEFRIRVKNVGEVTVDDMSMEDFLPDEMEFLDSEGLTETWDDFEPGDTVEFIIRAKVKDSEYDRENFEKCIVNKVEIFYEDNFEGSDTATVCYGDAEITELPETGAESTIALVATGLILITLGALVKKRVSAS